ncbi:hypothetical protein PGT21_007478 [Puccinia graminis f. sp. tritici]|uniref:Uncharacterized protein n=1 Tax=Puccinia graminis f. sp. tritici TaxID=56615 RepID=A0A5B0QMJ1_PUCGR|nr:hypothetical protein PGT21_007478 [Puccinia graminis f. sp. tritici]
MFAQNKNYFATNDKDFAPFVQAVVNNLTSKAMIKIIMENPNRSSKDSEEAKKVNDSLALNYADKDTHLAYRGRFLGHVGLKNPMTKVAYSVMED